MSQVIYYLPQNGTWTNMGTAGTAYNATVQGVNRYGTDSGTGAHYWGNFAAGDLMKIPYGSAVDNLSNISFEIGFYYTGTNGHVLCKLWDKNLAGFNLHVNENFGELCLQRYGTNGGASGYRLYAPITTAVVPGHYYYIQVAWAPGTNPQTTPYPTAYISVDGGNPIHQIAWDSDHGNVTTNTWFNDAVPSSNYCAIGNYSSDSERVYPLNGRLYVFRMYNSNEATFFSNGGNWATDKALKYGSPTVSHCTSSTQHPAVNQSVDVTGMLESNGTPLGGKSVTIYHTSGGTRYNDLSGITDDYGGLSTGVTHTTTGYRIFYLEYPGGGGYSASTSAGREIWVGTLAALTLIVDDATPTTGQTITFTANLKGNGVNLAGRLVTIYHYGGGSRIDDKSANTDANGNITYSTSFATSGLLYFYAEFAGDTSYSEITALKLIIDVAGEVDVVVTENTSYSPSDSRYARVNAIELASCNPRINETVLVPTKEGVKISMVVASTTTMTPTTDVTSSIIDVTGEAE